MRRRAFMTLIAGAAVIPALAARAQEKIWHLGWLDPNPPPAQGHSPPGLETFRRALAELGYVEGRNYVIEARFADTDNSRLPALADELVQDRVDMIVTIGTPTVVAAKKATSVIPIVMAGAADPIEHGLVASLAHPGGNITGVTHSPGPMFAGKGLEILKEVAPKVSRVAVLWDSTSVHEGLSLEALHKVADQLQLVLFAHDVKEVKSPDDFDPVFGLISQEADALFVFPNFINGKYETRIAEFALQNRLPSMSQDTGFVKIGGLISYYTNWLDLRRRAAVFVDKICKGASPAELPVEQPTRFELVISMKTAKAIGIAVPPAILARADEVIE